MRKNLRFSSLNFCVSIEVFHYLVLIQFFHLSDLLPTFITSASVTTNVDGISYIVGCQYVILAKPPLYLEMFIYIILNETHKIKLNGIPMKLNESTYKLPEHTFIASSTCKCLIKARNLDSQSVLSDLSAFVSVQDTIIYYFVTLNLIRNPSIWFRFIKLPD